MGRDTQDHDATNGQDRSCCKSDSDDFTHFRVAIRMSPYRSVRVQQSGM
jgi:hypothetical protein